MKFIVLTLMLLPGLAISSDLEVNRKAWESNRENSYSYTLKRGGVFGYSLYKIKIKNGDCRAKSKYVFDRTPMLWKKDSCEGNTIEELYESVRSQIAEGVIKMELTYDEKYSFISYFSVEPKTDYTDQDWYFEITKFKVK